MIVDASVDLADVQGNILRGYKKPLVRHLVLTVNDSAAARRWLVDATSGDAGLAHQVTTAAEGNEKPPTCLNVGMTYAGLAALGVAPKCLATFPAEFIDGMATRAVKLGDTGPSDPHHWKPEWRDPKKVHLVVSVHADARDQRDETADRVLGAGGGRAFVELARLDGQELPGGLVHFGYKDNIAQPHFDGIRNPTHRPDMQPLVEVGAVLLGYKTPVEDLRWEVPEPREDLGFNGSFNAFRVLEQQVDEFERFLSASADVILNNPLTDQFLPPKVEDSWYPPLSRRDAMRELVAAKVLGRWRNGVPLVLSPTSPTPYPAIGIDRLNKFDFTTDPDGLSCPMGSHIRRCNPRGARIVQRNTNHSRRIVRRGMPWSVDFSGYSSARASFHNSSPSNTTG